MKNLTNKTLIEFSEALAAKTSVPGGGGASAYVGALSAALCSMTLNFTLGKPGFEKYQQELESYMDRAVILISELNELVQQDAECFAPLSKAYSIPKDTPGRDEEMEKCLRLAASIPYKILEKTAEIVLLHDDLSKGKASPIIISDIGTGAAFAIGALKGAALNVKVNTRFMKDRAYAEEMNKKTNSILEKYLPIADECCERIAVQLTNG